MTSTCLMLTMLLVAPAGLEDNPNYQAGQAFYMDIEFEQAIVKFQIALGDPSLSPGERATVLLWLGVAYGQLGDDITARQSFKDAFALDPESPLPDIIPPTLKPAAEEEQAAARKAAEAARVVKEEAAAEAEAEAEAEAAEAAAQATAAADEATLGAGEEAPPSDADGLPWLLIGGGITAATSLLALSGAAAAVAWGVNSYLFATDSSNFQSDADGAVFQMNVAWIAAGSFSLVGLALVGGGAALAATDLILE